MIGPGRALRRRADPSTSVESSQASEHCRCGPMNSLDAIAADGQQLLDHLLLSYPAAAAPLAARRANDFIGILDRGMANAKYNVLPPGIVAAWREVVADCGGNEDAWAGVLLAALIACAPGRAASRAVPPELVPDLCEQLQRVASDLRSGGLQRRRLGDDLFLKDLGICRLDVLPCRSLLVEGNSGVPRRLALAGGIRQAWRFGGLFVSSGASLRPYFEIHAHTPMLGNFNPDGWDHCYRQVAVLLGRRTEYKGLVGGSWFFDPEVSRISPASSTLIRRPSDGGALFFRGGSSQADVANATATSARRRQLYEAGKYLPTSYFMVWPRKQLLEWAERTAG